MASRADDEKRSDRYNFLANEFIIGTALSVFGALVAIGGYFAHLDLIFWGSFVPMLAGSGAIIHSIFSDPFP